MCYAVKKSIIDILISNSKIQYRSIDGYLSFILVGNTHQFSEIILKHNLPIKTPLICYRSKKIMGVGCSQKNCITDALFNSAKK